MDDAPRWFFRSWQTDEGLPDNSVTGLVQTADGFIWVGTRGGFLRFNGNAFTEIALPRFDGPGSRVVRSVFRDGRDRLWIGMERGRLICLEAGNHRVYGPDEGLPPAVLRSITEDQDGNLWIAHTTGIIRFRDGRFEEFGADHGLAPGRGNPRVVTQSDGRVVWMFHGKIGVFEGDRPRVLHELSNPISDICAASPAGLWVCDGNRIHRFSDGVLSAEIARLPDQVVPRVMLEDRSGVLWVGTASDGLFRMEDGKVDWVPTSQSEVDCLLEDQEGNLWVGTAGGGMNQIRPRIMTLMNRQSGLPSDSARSVSEDAEGGIWVAFESGQLAHYREGRWHDESREGIEATCVAGAPDGAVWVGSRRAGLHRMIDGEWQTWRRSDGLAGNSVRSILVSSDGKVWIASEFPRRLQYYQDGAFQLIELPPELSVVRSMRAMTESADGTIWVGTAEGELLRVDGHRLVHEPATLDGTLHSIRSLHATDDGSVWIGHAGGGLGRWSEGSRHRLTTDHGLAENHFSQMLADGRGSIWVAGNRGVAQVGMEELVDVFEGRAERVRARVFGRAEGLPGLQASFDFSPSACVGRDGRLWFTMRNGLLMVRPEKLREHTEPPPVLLERVAVDDRVVAAYRADLVMSQHSELEVKELDVNGLELRVPPNHSKLEFDFAALSFTSPENVHFRYQLRGFDKRWIDADTRNRAIYPRLPAGNYEFHVIGCNHVGIWNETGSSIRVVVAPFYWQTWWFRGFALVFFTAVVIAIVRYVSFRRLRERMRELSQQAALDKERARIARDMHDEVGAKLTRLSLLSEMAAAAPELPAATSGEVREISDTARETILAFDEIVWAVNPRNDTLSDLTGYLCRHAEDFFEGSPTECMFELPAHIPPITLPTEARHEVFLAAKEALTNVAKYANASRVCLRLTLHADAFEVIIEDDGRGFDPATIATRPGGGNGLPNMRERMQRIGGRFECHSHPGGGTLIKFHVPIST